MTVKKGEVVINSDTLDKLIALSKMHRADAIKLGLFSIRYKVPLDADEKDG